MFGQSEHSERVSFARCSWVQRLTSRSACRMAAIAALKRRPSWPLIPCLRLFWLLLALPSAVFGPVLHVQGFQAWIAADCLALRSGVQALTRDHLQKFRRARF